MISSGTPPALARSNRLPSGPSGGPVISNTSSPCRRIRSSQQSKVFSCAPPRIIRVMMWAIRMDLHQFRRAACLETDPSYVIPSRRMITVDARTAAAIATEARARRAHAEQPGTSANRGRARQIASSPRQTAACRAGRPKRRTTIASSVQPACCACGYAGADYASALPGATRVAPPSGRKRCFLPRSWCCIALRARCRSCTSPAQITSVPAHERSDFCLGVSVLS